jgi:hypothetical protein
VRTESDKMRVDLLIATIKRIDWTLTGIRFKYYQSPAGASDPRRDDLAPRASRRGPVRDGFPPLYASKPLGFAIEGPFFLPTHPRYVRISLAIASQDTMLLWQYEALAL